MQFLLVQCLCVCRSIGRWMLDDPSTTTLIQISNERRLARLQWGLVGSKSTLFFKSFFKPPNQNLQKTHQKRNQKPSKIISPPSINRSHSFEHHSFIDLCHFPLVKGSIHLIMSEFTRIERQGRLRPMVTRECTSEIRRRMRSLSSRTLVFSYLILQISLCRGFTFQPSKIIQPVSFQHHAYNALSNRATYSSLTSMKLAEDDDDDEVYTPNLFADDDLQFSEDDLSKLTVSQLRQQLRLRGMKVGGNKSELISRLLEGTGAQPKTKQEVIEPEILSSKSDKAQQSKARQFAESRGKELIDVTEYLEEGDKGKDTKSSSSSEDEEEDEDIKSKEESSPETWGNEARIVDDYEGRAVVVDGLSRTEVEFKGSDKKKVKAYVVASRDSLKTFLAGGDRGNNSTELEQAVKNIQMTRERQSKVPMRLEDEQGQDVDDEEGHYTNVLDRDYGDWGKYSMTGVQMSAQEVKGIILLSDVYGPFSDDIQMLADKIAFECQPVVVFAPDMFRGKPWKEDSANPGFNDEGESYEEWRACHPDDRVSIDIRAAAAALREQYGVSSVSLFGLCYGGGRALEATARVYPNDTMDDVNGEEGPQHGAYFERN